MERKKNFTILIYLSVGDIKYCLMCMVQIYIFRRTHLFSNIIKFDKKKVKNNTLSHLL